MLLGKLLKTANKKYKKIPIKGISFDSRTIKKNYIFFAITGNTTSGDKFINDAISLGASAIVSNKKFKLKNKNTPFIIVKDVRKALAEACSNLYKRKPFNIVAVTGTNGKSSVADFFFQILNLNKVNVASIGTLGINSKYIKKKSNLTSMDPISLHKNLEILAKEKINNVILEASSHGLEQKRLDNLKIKSAVFTNFSHDHLDYHKNMKSYFNAKMHLFKNVLKKKSLVITDEENKEFKILNNIILKKKLKKNSIGINSGNLKIIRHKYNSDRQIVRISINSDIFTIEIPLIGYFQIKNFLMAVLAALECGININEIFKILPKIKSVSGRLESIAIIKKNANIIVDFAHTPDALEQTLIALKNQFKKKIIIVFGCGGERDKKKRLYMGKIAKKYCRKAFITDDNPRNEDPKKIRKTIMKGCKKIAIEIGSRKKAIQFGIKELKNNEILLVAGKGHEKTQDYGKKIINFSDKDIIKKIIKNKKSRNKKNFYPEILSKKLFNSQNFKNLNYNGVSINSKTIKKNNIFFAIKGKKLNGHKFVKTAIKKGAIKSIVSKKINNISNNKIIRVKNTLLSLNELAKVTRENSFAKIIGITGSVGKTTLKNLVGFSLKNYGSVYHSLHSYNNKFGVPLSLANLKNDNDYGVFEIGMDKKGEINNLSKIVKPEIAVITNISEAHLKNFKNIKDIAEAKSEIINNISRNGSIILNKDNKFFSFFSTKAKMRGVNIISFSVKKKADVFLLEAKKWKNIIKLKVSVKNKIFYFYIKHFTESLLQNILACISVIYTLNLNLKKLKRKFINFQIPEGRGDVTLIKKFNKKFKFIDESYNANPLSMKLAIKNMSSYIKKKNQRRLIFLSDMLELGKNSKKFHKALSFTINKSDINKVFVLGKHIKETFYALSFDKKGKIFKNLDEAYEYFAKNIRNNDLLMVKGSNATGLNQFSKNIKRG